MSRRKKKKYNVFAISILVMTITIFILCIVVGVKLFFYLTFNPLNESNLQEAQAASSSSDGGQETYAYILTARDSMNSLSERKFRKFAENIVSDSPYSWITLDFQDGTGIVFTGTDTSRAAYGYLDSDRCISEVFGYITLEEDTYRYTAL